MEGYIKAKKKSNLNDLACRKLFTGFLSFVEACVKLNELEFAKDFIKRIENSDDLIKAYCIVGEPMKGAEIAYQKDDIRGLQRIISLCREADDREKLVKYISTIKLKLATAP
uniref:Vps16 C-terminal domain-containing protein n=1 Tax=Panagrolaimus superbus TaxID=310955 RepID=A0A914Z2I6_9BILA